MFQSSRGGDCSEDYFKSNWKGSQKWQNCEEFLPSHLYYIFQPCAQLWHFKRNNMIHLWLLPAATPVSLRWGGFRRKRISALFSNIVYAVIYCSSLILIQSLLWQWRKLHCCSSAAWSRLYQAPHFTPPSGKSCWKSFYIYLSTLKRHPLVIT